MRAPILCLALAALLAAGCSGEENDSGNGGEPVKVTTADSFIDCFDKPGFEAKTPKPREESVLAYYAKSNGHNVEPVNVVERGMLSPAAFLVFFDSPEKATAAVKELDATSFGEVPPVKLGPAVIGYGDTENQAAVSQAIDACIE